METEVLAIGSDHTGVDLKLYLKEKLTAEGYEVIDCGTDSKDAIDYPDIAKVTCTEVLAGRAAAGVLICGTGIGMSISANKMPGIRAALVNEAYSAKMAKKHNNANFICLGARTTGPDLAFDVVMAFLKEQYEGGRHQRRIDKISELEKQ